MEERTITAINAIKTTLDVKNIHRHDVIDVFFEFVGEEYIEQECSDLDNIYSILGEADEEASGLWSKGQDYYDAHQLSTEEYDIIAKVIYNMFH